MKTSQTKIIVAVVFMLVLAGTALYTFFYRSILQKKIDIVTLTQGLANEVDKAKNLGKNKVLFDNMATKRDMLNSYFLGAKDEDTVAFLVALETLASSTKVTLEIETPSLVPITKQSNKQNNSKDPAVLGVGDIDSSKWELLRLQIKLDGKWADIMQFVGLVETMPFKTNFTQASLNAVEDVNQKIKTKTWHGVLTLTVVKSK